MPNGRPALGVGGGGGGRYEGCRDVHLDVGGIGSGVPAPPLAAFPYGVSAPRERMEGSLSLFRVAVNGLLSPPSPLPDD